MRDAMRARMPHNCEGKNRSDAGSDVAQERVWHVVCPAIGGGFSLIAAAYIGNPILAAVALTISAMGIYAALPEGLRGRKRYARGHCT